MDEINDYSKDYKAFGILVKALIAGIVLFSLISIAVHYTAGSFIKDINWAKTVFVVDLIFGAILIIAARTIYFKKINVLQQANQTAKEKLDLYRGILIVHIALCEFLAIFSIICFMLFGDFLFFLVLLMALIEMIKKFFSVERMNAIINSGTL